MTSPQRASFGGRAFAVIGGVLFPAALGYFLASYVAFGKSSGPWSTGGWRPAVFNVLLFTLFALHHSVFARSGLKRVINAHVSEPLERATYVWLASALFALTLWAWAPVPGTVWAVTGIGAWVLNAGCLAGLVLTGVAATALDPLDLAGIRQAFGIASREDRQLSTTGAYGLVRHPIYLGWLLIVWSVPVMTGTRLVFAAISTIYLVIAVPFEEREMRRSLGRKYEDYARDVRWRMLPWVY